MKAKNRKHRKKKSSLGKIILLILLTLILIAEVLWLLDKQGSEEAIVPYMPTSPVVTEVATAAPVPTEADPGTDAPTESISPEELEEPNPLSIKLGNGLYLEKFDKYTGAYMEDGSDEIVSGILMASITNSGDKDLQYAKIEAAFGTETYSFEITDLPAGASVIALEKNRATLPSDPVTSAVLVNSAFFAEKMNTYPEMLKVSGADGMLNVKNITDSDITDDIYIHYKNVIDEVYYGGIAYRVRIEGGLKAGEIRQIMTGHFNPENCRIVAIELIPKGNG